MLRGSDKQYNLPRFTVRTIDLIASKKKTNNNEIKFD